MNMKKNKQLARKAKVLNARRPREAAFKQPAEVSGSAAMPSRPLINSKTHLRPDNYLIQTTETKQPLYNYRSCRQEIQEIDFDQTWFAFRKRMRNKGFPF